MAEFVRVRLENGAHKSMPKARADALGLTPLKQDAYARDGRPAATKLRASKGAGHQPTTSTQASTAKDAQEG